jgi:hypothetical protein
MRARVCVCVCLEVDRFILRFGVTDLPSTVRLYNS